MALLLGQETEGTGAEEIVAVAEIGASFKFTASAGKVTALAIKFSANGTGTSGRLALQADNAGKPAEGVLCEGPITAVTAGEHVTTSLTAEPTLVAGTEYWLTAISLAGNFKMKVGSTTSRAKTTVKHPLISEIKTADWAAAQVKGPSSIWATGTESGTKVEGKAAGTLLLTGTAAGTAANVVSGKATGALLLTGTAKGTAANVVVGKASGALLLTGTAKGAVSEGGIVKGKASGAILLTGTAKGALASLVKGKAAGALLLTGKATGTASAVVVGKASGRLALTGTGTGTLQAVVLGVASGTLRLTGSGTGTTGGVVTVSHPGLVSPSSRAGRTSPTTLAGLVNPSEKTGGA